jgi:hypothetical protein
MFDGLDQSLLPLYVAPADWPVFAERLRPHLAKMAEGSGGRYAAEDLPGLIEGGHFQLWLVLDGADIACALLTQIMQYPRLRALRAVGVVGHRPLRWTQMLSAVEKAARAHFGCVKMEALCNPRHVCLLRTGGWREFHVLLEKDL